MHPEPDLVADVVNALDYFSTCNENTHPALSVRSVPNKPTGRQLVAYYRVCGFRSGVVEAMPRQITQRALTARDRAFRDEPITLEALLALGGATEAMTCADLLHLCRAAGRDAYVRHYGQIACQTCI
jgi:hypothetical protein